MSRTLLHKALSHQAVPPRYILTTEPSFDGMYVEPRFALLELSRRRYNVRLRRKTREFDVDDQSSLAKQFVRPRAVLFRQLATPTHEVLRFLRMARLMELEPLILEYAGDKFVSTGNRYKRSLGKMPLYQHTGSDARDLMKYHTLFDFNSYTGKSLETIVCRNGKRLIDVHHALFNQVTHLNPKKICFDATRWFQSIGNGKASAYYRSLLSFFIRDGILFENYFTTPSERPFVESVVIPAFNGIVETYNEKPLIVQLLPDNDSQRLFWDAYPKKVEKLIQ